MLKEQDVILLNTWESLKEFITNNNNRDANVFVKDNVIFARKSNLNNVYDEQPKWAVFMERRIFNTLNKIDSRLTNVENRLDNVIRVNKLKTE